MAVPEPNTFLDGQVVDAQALNHLNDMLTFLIRPPRAQVEALATQTIANAVDVTLNWDTVNEDTDGLWDPSHPDRLTIQTDGWYEVSMSASVAANANLGREALITKNGVRLVGVDDNAPTWGNAAYNAVVTTAVRLVKGDYIGVILRQNSGSALNTLSSPADGRRNLLTVLWAGGV